MDASSGPFFFFPISLHIGEPPTALKEINTVSLETVMAAPAPFFPHLSFNSIINDKWSGVAAVM